MTALSSVVGRGVDASKPSAGTPGRLYFSTDLSTWYRDNGSSWDTCNSGGGALTNTTNQLGSAVTLTSTNTFYDGPSVSLAAGTWALYASLTIQGATAGTDYTCKLWDGTTAVATCVATLPATNYCVNPSLVGIVSPTGTTTYKVSVARDGGTGTHQILATAVANAAGNTASTLVAVKIG